MIRVTWEKEIEVASIEELDGLLDSLHIDFSSAKDPTLISVWREDGNCMAIGLGAERSALSFTRADLDPPYYSSVGEAEGSRLIAFNFGGTMSEYPWRNTVPLDAARDAIRRFCLGEDLPANIRWEEV
jgi:hypothetical protein